MTAPRRTLVAFALVAAVAAASAALALGGGAGPPKRALVTSHRLHAQAALGSYCTSAPTGPGTSSGGCGDAEYPLHPRAFLPITPDSSVRANLRGRAKSVEASFVQGRDAPWGYVGKLDTKPVPGTHRRVWRIHMPGDLMHADALALFVKFAGGGDADFWVGVKPVERWP